MPGLDPALRPKTKHLWPAEPGEEWEIDGINEPAEEDHQLMTFYESHGFKPGARLKVTDVASFDSTMTVVIGGNTLTIGKRAAENLRIVVEPAPATLAGAGRR
jgi:Fe2+ transport system protein FeoA